VSDAQSGLQRYFARYNQFRPHSALDDKTPNEFYFESLPAMQKTA
jgi:putative transposase